MTNHRAIVAAALSGASLFVIQTPASAESGAETASATEPEGDILITATRPAYRGDFDELEIPQAEQVIGPQQLRDINALDLNAALDLSASVARQNNFGGLWNSFAVRGFVGDENLPSNYLVNGFNAGRGFAGPRDLSGIEAVEVLKGPRAALFGRGEPGGTINLVTKRPRFESAGEVRLLAGSFDTYRADADLQTTLGDAVGVRFVGFYEDAGSFRDTIETERFGFMPSVAVKLGEATRIVYELEYARQEIPFDRGVVAVNGELGLIPQSRFLGEPGEGPNIAEVLGHQLELQHDFSDNWSALVGIGYRDTSLQGTSTEAELTGSRQQLFRDGRTLTRQRRFRDYDATYFVARAELAGNFTTGDVTHRVLIGADTDRFENDQVFLRARAPSLASNPTEQQLQAIDIFDPVYGRFPLPALSPLTDRVEVQKATGVYAQYQIGLSDSFELRVGGRYDDYDQRLTNRANGSVARTGEQRFSPQVGAVWRATPELSLYATYGENFRPLSGADFAGNPFDPNQSESVEAGVKYATADGRMSATASIFAIQQGNILVGDPANAGFTLAGGEARSRGFEFDFNGEIVGGLDLWVSYAYVDAEVENDVPDPDFGKLIEAGDRLLNIPEHTLNVQLAYSTVIAGRDARFGGGVLHVGERLGEVGTDFELPDYTLARIFAEAELTDGIRLRFDIDNLFDTEWFANSFSQLWVQPGMPRNARVTASFAF
ncbi:TonB-dependent siderophore receptor [Erythrobacter dokdonensis]|uniref:Putative TonB-dependent receptor for ferrichrome transport n=1 Tax=Erythrobacter dokdonensis DSW-74 TaxID=1300349 RepID=A0A1A7BMK6_9SPHN|nr:TonB-dependent siderophore receptor [Erythrobacter dokdonensis]OBV12390.1 putative TonB-dependent receptor for ferrichrome transport [Erythrobacter dokdonensis DSW-74]